MFRRMDDDGSKQLSFSEFRKGMDETGCQLTDEETRDLFERFDRDGSGSINVDELLIGLRVSSLILNFSSLP